MHRHILLFMVMPVMGLRRRQQNLMPSDEMMPSLPDGPAVIIPFEAYGALSSLMELHQAS